MYRSELFNLLEAKGEDAVEAIIKDSMYEEYQQLKRYFFHHFGKRSRISKHEDGSAQFFTDGALTSSLVAVGDGTYTWDQNGVTHTDVQLEHYGNVTSIIVDGEVVEVY